MALRSEAGELRKVVWEVSPVGPLIYLWPSVVPTLSQLENDRVHEAAEIISAVADFVIRVPESVLGAVDYSPLFEPHWTGAGQKRVMEWVASEVARLV